MRRSLLALAALPLLAAWGDRDADRWHRRHPPEQRRVAPLYDPRGILPPTRTPQFQREWYGVEPRYERRFHRQPPPFPYRDPYQGPRYF